MCRLTDEQIGRREAGQASRGVPAPFDQGFPDPSFYEPVVMEKNAEVVPVKKGYAHSRHSH